MNTHVVKVFHKGRLLNSTPVASKYAAKVQKKRIEAKYEEFEVKIEVKIEVNHGDQLHTASESVKYIGLRSTVEADRS